MKFFSNKSRALRFVVAIALLCVAVFTYIEYSKHKPNAITVLVSTPQLQSVEIDSYSNLEDGQRAAIQELSRQLKAHPKTRDFSLSWNIANSNKICEMEYANGWLLKSHVYTVSVGPWRFIPRPPFVGRQTVWDNGETSLIWWPRLSPQEIHKSGQQNKTYDEIYKQKLEHK